MFGKNIENMGDAAGATQQAYGDYGSGIGRSIEKIKNSMGIMMLELGESQPCCSSDILLIIY